MLTTVAQRAKRTLNRGKCTIFDARRRTYILPNYLKGLFPLFSKVTSKQPLCCQLPTYPFTFGNSQRFTESNNGAFDSKHHISSVVLLNSGKQFTGTFPSLTTIISTPTLQLLNVYSVPAINKPVHFDNHRSLLTATTDLKIQFSGIPSDSNFGLTIDLKAMEGTAIQRAYSIPGHERKPLERKLSDQIVRALEALKSTENQENCPPVMEEDMADALKEYRSKLCSFQAISVLERLKDLSQAMAFLRWLGKQPDQRPTVDMYSLTIDMAEHSNQLNMVKSILQEMKESGCQPDIGIYSRAIQMLGMAGMVQDAADVKRQMEEAGVPPQENIHKSMVDAYCKNGLYKDAFKEMKLMRANGFDGNMTSQMVASGQRSLSRCLRMFREIIRRGVEDPQMAWAAIINLHGRAGKKEEAIKLFDEMIQQGMQPSLLVYNSILNIYAKNGLQEDAEALFEKMVREGIDPDEIAWGTMLHMWARANEPIRVGAWFRRMVQAGQEPGEVSFNILLSSFIKARKFAEAMAVFQSMRRRINLGSTTYVFLLTNCTKCDDGEGVEMLLEMMDLCGHPTHEIARLLLLQGSGGDESVWEKVRHGLDRMSQESPRDRYGLFSGLIMFLQRTGLNLTAGRVWEEARVRNMYSHAVTCKSGVWSLDLHNMGDGTAMIALNVELERLRDHAIGTVGYSFPPVVRIVTGWGQRSQVRGMSPVKLMVREQLQEWGSPFVEDPCNSGAVLADGKDVGLWMFSNGGDHRFKLKDVGIGTL